MANKSKTTSSSREKTTVLSLAICALLFCTCTAYFAFHYCPCKTPTLPTLLDRITYTLRWQVFSIAILLVGVMACGNQRFLTLAINPLRGQDNLVAVHKQFVQNTCEQLVLNVSAQLILTTYLQEESMKLIPILVLLFVVGRLTFWIGYLLDPVKRAFGFACTFYPTFATIIYCAYSALTKGFSVDLGTQNV